jgi:O-antigen ligase
MIDHNNYRPFKGFLIFTAFYMVFYYYHQTVIYDRLYLLVAVQTAIFAIYLISVYRIKIGLYIFLFLLPLLNSVTTIIGIRRVTISFYLFVGLFLGYLVNQFSSGRKIRFEAGLSRPILVFIMLVTLSSAIVIYRYANFVPFITFRFHDLIVNNADHTSMGAIMWTLKYFFNYLAGFGLLVIIFNVLKKKKDFIISLVIVLLTSILVILFGFYQKLFHPTLGSSTFWVEAGRINSTFTDPNALGGYVALIFPLFVTMIIFFRKWYQKLAAAILLAVFVYFGLLSGSRSAFLAMAVSSFIFMAIGLSMLVRKQISRKVKASNRSALLSGGIVIAFFAVLIISFMLVMTQTSLLDNLDESLQTGIIVLDRMTETIADYSTSVKTDSIKAALEDISSGREALWRQAIYMFSEHPVSGVGHAAYFIELPDYHLKHPIGFPLLDFTGNYYLQILSEMGLAGMLLILFIYFLIIKKPVKYFLHKNGAGSMGREDWLAAGLLISFAAMACALFFGPHTNFMEIQFLFWMVIGLLLGYLNISSGDDGVLEAAGYKGVRFDKVSKISLGTIIFIFGATLLWSSTHDLSINVKNSLYDHDNDHGFYQEEYEEGIPYRWTAGDALTIVARKSNAVVIPMKWVNPEPHRIPNFVRIYVDNTLVKIVKLDDDGWHDVSVDLKKFDRERVTITLSMNHYWVPAELGLSSDTRELGIKAGDFRFED